MNKYGKTIVLSAAVACLFMAGQAVGQGGDKPDELRFNGDKGDNKQQQATDNAITPGDNSRPLVSPVRPNGGQQYAYDDTALDRPGRGPFGGPFQDPFAPLMLPFGGIFGGDSGFSPSPLQQQQQQLPARPFSFLDNLMGSLHRHSSNMHQNFERQFQDLERRAGEGQDVSYFNRNGVAYVRTCTTKRVSPAGADQSSGAKDATNGQQQQPEQQLQQQLQPETSPASEVPAQQQTPQASSEEAKPELATSQPSS